MRLRLIVTVMALTVGAAAFVGASFRPETSSLNTTPNPVTQPQGYGEGSPSAFPAESKTPREETSGEQALSSSEETSLPEETTQTSATGSPQGGESSPQGSQGEQPVTNPEAVIAAELVQAANVERQQAGLAPLQVSTLLTEQASWWAAHMPEAGYNHSSTERLQTIMDAGSYSAVGENLHAPEPQCAELRNCPDVNDQPTSRVVLIDWVNSPSHRDNLFDRRWGQVGIGVHCGADGRMWVAALFSTEGPTQAKPARNVSAPQGNHGMTCFGIERAHNPQWQHP